MKAWMLVTICGGVLALAACGAPRSGGTLPEVNAGLNALAANRGADLRLDPTIDPTAPLPNQAVKAMAEQAALDLQAVMSRAEQPTAPAPTATPNEEPAPFSLSSADHAAPPKPVVVSAPAFAAEPSGAVPAGASANDLTAKAEKAWSQAATPVKPEPVARPSPEDELVELAAKMARLLREPSTRERPRITDSAAIAPIEAMRPGAVESLETTGSTLSQRLSDQDRRTLLEARDRVANTSVPPSKTGAGVTGVPTSALRVAKATLCTRVMGFGKYNAYSGTSFAAGKPVPAIVYVEVENFSARPAREGDPLTSGASLSEQVSVDLAQSLTLYQDPSGLQAWHRPPQSVVETGRNQRRDFYLIQQIELPRTLSIGRYNLKVTVKDRSSGQEAEAIIPISIVAK